MNKQLLHTGWQMTRLGEEDWIPAAVPGSVYSDLLNAGRMEDPYWRDNEMKALPLMDHDYLYTTTFAADEAVLNSDCALLRCEGLDTLAEVTLNGVLLGSTNNMHRTWEYDVKNLLKNEDNKLEIVFRSPLKYIEEQDKVCLLYTSGQRRR